MDHTSDYSQMLNMIPAPAFTVQNGVIACCNLQAQQLLIEPGKPVHPLLVTGAEDYAALTSGCLYLDVKLRDTVWGANITRLSEQDLFCLEQTGVTPELKAMSLLCSQLRIPFANLMLSTTRSPEGASGEILRELDRITRIFNNVSNAHRFVLDDGYYRQERNICSVLEELLHECAELLQQAQIKLNYTLPKRDIFTVLDHQMLRQAVYNLLDNAARNTAPGGQIDAALTANGTNLRLSVTDYGTGLSENVRSSLFSRYIRQPGIEDGLNGLGMGMTIVRTTASAHGGTVLVDQPEGTGTRVTMTIAIQHHRATSLRTPLVGLVMPRDDGKVMLSNVLPTSLYEKK